MKKTRTMKPRVEMMVPRAIKRRFPHVTKVVDAVKPLDIDVTEDDGDGGAASDFEQCALARAACRQLRADHALVSKRVIYVVKGDSAVRYGTSEKLRMEISSYDRHKDFAEGHYTLRPKRPSERLGVQRLYPPPPRPDTRPRHDVSPRRWSRVRDLNVADAAESKAQARGSKKKKRAA